MLFYKSLALIMILQQTFSKYIAQEMPRNNRFMKKCVTYSRAIVEKKSSVESFVGQSPYMY